MIGLKIVFKRAHALATRGKRPSSSSEYWQRRQRRRERERNERATAEVFNWITFIYLQFAWLLVQRRQCVRAIATVKFERCPRQRTRYSKCSPCRLVGGNWHQNQMQGDFRVIIRICLFIFSCLSVLLPLTHTVIHSQKENIYGPLMRDPMWIPIIIKNRDNDKEFDHFFLSLTLIAQKTQWIWKKICYVSIEIKKQIHISTRTTGTHSHCCTGEGLRCALRNRCYAIKVAAFFFLLFFFVSTRDIFCFFFDFIFLHPRHLGWMVRNYPHFNDKLPKPMFCDAIEVNEEKC